MLYNNVVYHGMSHLAYITCYIAMLYNNKIMLNTIEFIKFYIAQSAIYHVCYHINIS